MPKDSAKTPKEQKRKRDQAMESPDERSEDSAGMQTSTGDLEPEVVTEELEVLKALMEAAKVDESWGTNKRGYASTCQAHEKKWALILRQQKKEWKEAMYQEYVLRFTEGRFEDAHSHPESNNLDQVMKDGIRGWVEGDDWFKRKHIAAEVKLDSEYEHFATGSKNARARITVLYEALIPMQEQIAAATRRVAGLKLSQSKDVKRMQELRLQCEYVLDFEDDLVQTGGVKDYADSLNRLTVRGPFSSPTSTSTDAQHHPSGTLARNDGIDRDASVPRYPATPASPRTSEDTTGVPSTALVSTLTLKPLDKISAAPVRKFLAEAEPLASNLSARAFQRWLTEEAMDTLDTMAHVDARFKNWRQMDKGELCTLLREAVVKGSEDKYVHSFEEMFSRVTIMLDAENLTSYGLAEAFTAVKEKLKRFSTEIAKAEQNPKDWKLLSTLLLQMFEHGHTGKGEKTGLDKDKLAETKTLRKVVAHAVRQRCNLPKENLRAIDSCELLWIALITEVLARREAFMKDEAVYTEMAEVRRASKKPRYEQTPKGGSGAGAGASAAPKGGPGHGVSAGPRLPCTCGRTHAMPCRSGGKAVQGGAPTYAQQASGGTQLVKSEYKSEYKTEYKPKQVALRAFTADEVMAQLDGETRKRVTQQLDQKANGGSDPKEKKPKGQKKGYDPTVYQPKGPQ